MRSNQLTRRLAWPAILAVVVGSLALSGPSLAGQSDRMEAGDKVDINRAGQEELEELPGIGPATAARILEYRDEHGPFRRIEDLMNVRGIGEKKFLQLRAHITVGETRPRK